MVGSYCRSKISSRAFSLIEFVIALGLLALVAVFVIGYFLIGSSDRELQSAKTEAVSRHQEVSLRLQQIFDDAVKNTGPTVQDGLLGIQRLSPESVVLPGEPRAPSEQSDHIWLLLERFPDFTAPVTVPTPGPGEDPRLAVDLAVLDSEQQSYFTTGISNSDFFVVSNLETTAIFQRQGGFDGSEVDIVPPTDPNFSSAFSGLSSRLTLGERVNIVVDYQNRLVSRNQRPSITRPDRVLAENIFDFDVNYRFAKQTLTGDVMTTEISAPGDQAACFGDTCVNWSDLAQVVIRTTYDLGVEWPDDELSSIGTSYIELPNGNLGYVASQSFAPAKYKRGLGELGFQGNALCSVSNPLNRCNPECAFAFTDDSPTSAAFEEYGAHVGTANPSAYCMCGTDVDGSGDFESFSPPTNNMGLGFYRDEDEEGRRRLDACAAHYAEQDCRDMPRWLKDRHPLARVACYCVENKENFLDEDTFSYADGRFSFSGDAIDELGGLVASGSANSSAEFKCNSWQQHWPYYSNCDRAANDLWGTSGTTNWSDNCRCQPTEDDGEGGRRDQGLYSRDFDSMCNLSGAPSACPNLRPEDGDGDGIADDPAYQYFDPNIPASGTEGFAARGPLNDPYRYDMAIVCECMRATGERGYSRHSFDGAFHQIWDFRTGLSGDRIGSLISGVPGNVDSESSRGSITVDVDVRIGNSQPLTIQGAICNQAVSRLAPSTRMVAQCTHPSGPTSRDGRLRTDFDVTPWREYCNGNCGGLDGGRLCRVRAVLTNQDLDACDIGYDPCVQGPPDPDPPAGGADETGF